MQPKIPHTLDQLKINKLYGVCKIYGPYLREDGRMHVILYDGISRKTVSYPKLLMEQHLERLLTKDETVDHIDRDFKNNKISNFRVITLSNNIKDDVKRAELIEITCVRVGCGKKAFKRANQLSHNAKLGKAGPFCDKICAGKYSAGVQNGSAKLPTATTITVSERKYYQNTKIIPRELDEDDDL